MHRIVTNILKIWENDFWQFRGFSSHIFFPLLWSNFYWMKKKRKKKALYRFKFDLIRYDFDFNSEMNCIHCNLLIIPKIWKKNVKKKLFEWLTVKRIGIDRFDTHTHTQTTRIHCKVLKSFKHIAKNDFKLHTIFDSIFFPSCYCLAIDSNSDRLYVIFNTIFFHFCYSLIAFVKRNRIVCDICVYLCKKRSRKWKKRNYICLSFMVDITCYVSLRENEMCLCIFFYLWDRYRDRKKKLSANIIFSLL